MNNLSEKTQQLLNTLVENEPVIKEVNYNKGMFDGENAAGDGIPWDAIQNDGNRTDYDGGFAYWDIEELSPKHKVVPQGYCLNLFLSCKKLKTIDKDKFDLSKAYYSDEDTLSAATQLCSVCTKLEVFPDIGLQAGYYFGTWNGCSEMHTIEKIRVNENCDFSTGTFRGCRKLQNILDIEGLFGKSVVFAQCSSLTPATMKNIIKHLKFYKETELEAVYTISFNSTPFSALEEEGISEEDWEWVAEQFPDADMEVIKWMIDSWETFITVLMGWALTIV